MRYTVVLVNLSFKRPNPKNEIYRLKSIRLKKKSILDNFLQSFSLC